MFWFSAFPKVGIGLQEDLLQILQRWVCVACPCVLSETPRIGSRNHIPARILRLAYKKLLAVYRIGLARLRLPPHATRHHRTAPRVRGGRKLVSVDLASPILYLPSRCHHGGGMRLPLIVVLCFQPFGLVDLTFQPQAGPDDVCSAGFQRTRRQRNAHVEVAATLPQGR